MVASLNAVSTAYSTSVDSSAKISLREGLVYNEMNMMNSFFDQQHPNVCVDVARRIALQYDNILVMQSKYQGESIHYANGAERRSDYQIFTYEGKLYNADGSPVNTAPLDFDKGAILVMDASGNLFLSHKKRGEIHHSTVFRGGSVAYACMLEARDGEIIKEMIWSGHYKPSVSEQRQFHDRLRQNVTHSNDPRMITIFLSTCYAVGHPMFDRTCIIGKSPLFDAVKLPCGHIYSEHELKKREVLSGRFCVMDRLPYEPDRVIPAEETRKDVEALYMRYLEDVMLFNQRSIVKALSLKFRYPDLRGMEATEGGEECGLYLSLPANLPTARISEIAREVGLGRSSTDPYYESDSTFILLNAGKPCRFDTLTSLAEVKERYSIDERLRLHMLY